ncbi:TPA: hypothetical protein NNT57_004622 [Salmonella enterica]|uniref:Putative head-tail joining protein n=2 Tax=Lokivirus IMEAB3 TaxID=2560266 RepID=A0A481S207_9CAUD|nr:head-tail adaptor Ad1 [Acinetobacter phage IMEAB3]QBG78748.1 putative head-tail joining protein [Acinetobacter phage vB_AbaS_D0]WUU86633.1 head-tail adaptor [Acinetobacter phage vB_AbaSi_W9]HCH8772153.1 hypothetical protein [Salmonella enterica]AHI60034.1 putative structural protein [Acinetobacter phage IMEAB3]HCH9143078.1 hypothetical protein [Salmonella enterica]
MAITLVIEDGTGLANANTYVSVEETRNYALNRGVILSANDDDVAVQLIKSADYLNSLECEFKSLRLNDSQALAFPRIGLGVPDAVRKAQMQGVIEQANGFDLLPTISASNYVTKEKVGDLEVQYADPIVAGVKPVFAAIDALLFSLMKKNCQTGGGFISIRV